MCTSLVSQHHSCRTIQVFARLRIRKSALALSCQYSHAGAAAWLGRFGVSPPGSERSLLNHSESMPWVIRREMPASWKTSPELNNVLQDVIKIINHIKVHALNSRLFTQLCEEMDTEHTRLLLHTEVRRLSKGRSLARVFELWELVQRFRSEKVTTGSTFQWHRMGRKTCLLVWHIQPAQQTHSVTSGENDNCVQVSRKRGCVQSQTGIMGAKSEHWDSWHVSNISRDFEGGWARACFLPAGAWSPISAFKRLSITAQPQKTPELGRNGSTAHLWTSQVNRLCAGRGSLLEIANDDGLESMLETTSDLWTFWIKVKVKYPEIATKARKSQLPFPTSCLCEAGFPAVTAPKWDYGVHGT